MATTIADLWIPQIWIRGIDEGARSFAAFVTSGVIAQSPTFDAIAIGGGISANLPFFKDITDQPDAPQVEGTAPALDKIGSGLNVAAILNREKAWSVTALSAAVSASDPVAAITRQFALRRQKNRQNTGIAILRGLFNVAGAPGAAAALQTVRYDAFLEDNVSPTAAQLIDIGKFNLAVALMGELQDVLSAGAIIAHPNIIAALKTQDADAFSADPPSKTGFRLERYQNIPLYSSRALVRAGVTTTVVYDTYICQPGVIAWGEKPQLPDQIDAASLQFYLRKDINDSQIYDRTRYLMHVNGTKWVGVPAGQSATDVELATPANWQLAYTTADRIGVVCIRTNG